MIGHGIEKLVYRSTRCPAAEDDFEEMMERARTRNAAEAITGALVYDDRRFLQILEGSRPAVADCYLRIARNPMHRCIEIGVLCNGAGRIFARWHLASVRVGRPALTLDAVWNRIMRAHHDTRVARFEAAFLNWIGPDG